MYSPNNFANDWVTGWSAGWNNRKNDGGLYKPTFKVVNPTFYGVNASVTGVNLGVTGLAVTGTIASITWTGFYSACKGQCMNIFAAEQKAVANKSRLAAALQYANGQALAAVGEQNVARALSSTQSAVGNVTNALVNFL